MSANVAHSALLILEIQDRIFSFNEVGDAFQCSLVCKSWLPVALDRIWHTLPLLLPLFNYLAPVATSQNGSFKFERHVIASDRMRFSSIAARVKCLSVSKMHEIPCEATVNELLKSRLETTGSILPNLKRLTINTGRRIEVLDLIIPFLHSRLDVLDIVTGPDDRLSSVMEGFLEEIMLRSPSLRKLTVNIAIQSIPKITRHLIKLLSDQQSLEVLCLPPGMLTGPVLECLSRHSRLRQISFTHLPKEDINLNPPMTLPCDESDESSRFPSLVCLDLWTPLSSAASFISAYPAFARLERLQILSNDAKDLHQFLEVISNTCENLEALLMPYGGKGDGSTTLDALSTPVTKDTLAPLRSFCRLRKLILDLARPISMSDDDLVEFLDSCSELVEFELKPHLARATFDDSLLPSLAVIPRIARVQPKLESLSMCFNGLDRGFEDSLTDVTTTPFQKLKTLDVSSTRVAETDKTALFLSQLLPSDCKLDFGPFEGGMKKLWKEVVTKFLLLVPTFSRYKEHSRNLNKEIVRLKETMKAAGIVLESTCPSEYENRLDVTTFVKMEMEHAE